MQAYPEILRKITITSLRWLRQECDRLHQTVCWKHIDLQQVSYGVHGRVRLGANGLDLIFIDAGVKNNGAYYREMLLT